MRSDATSIIACGTLLWFGVIAAFWIAVGCVAIHYIAKFW